MKIVKIGVHIERSIQIAPYKFFKQSFMAEAEVDDDEAIGFARKELEDIVVNEVRKMGNNEIKRYELEQE